MIHDTPALSIHQRKFLTALQGRIGTIERIGVTIPGYSSSYPHDLVLGLVCLGHVQPHGPATLSLTEAGLAALAAPHQKGWAQ